MVVIDNSPGCRTDMEHEEIPLIHGDATTEDILLEAGTKERKVVLWFAPDTDNVFITMSARGLNPNLSIRPSGGRALRKKADESRGNRVVCPITLRAENGTCYSQTGVSDFLELTVHNRKLAGNG